MEFAVLWTYLTLYITSVCSSSFLRILRTNIPDNKNVLDIYTTENHAECAKACTADCLSFTLDTTTKECTTFDERICRNDTAAALSSIMTFVKVEPGTTTTVLANPTDCSQIDPIFCSGVYRITPSEGLSFDVYCDMDTPDGPWTVIQNRESNDVNFYRSWNNYKTGFGDLNGNFWLGNDAIHYLSTIASVLRINLVTWMGDERYAEYSTFKVENETDNYALTASGFSGTAWSDAMGFHTGHQFSTYDNDNDVWKFNCAVKYRGGWWYRSCNSANLNGGIYYNGTDNYKAVAWNYLYEGIRHSHIMKTRMLLKRPHN